MVNLNLFVEPIETFHPKSLDYRKYWAEIKRRCIEGYWIGGKYCPPSLYFYLNLGTIWIKKSRFSKSQIKGRPRNLDYLWDRINYPWMEARGITGFSNLPNPTEAELRDILYNYSPTGNLGRPLYERDPRNMILMTSRGSGKLLKRDEKIRIKDGWKTIEELEIGEKVYSIDGTLTKIKNKTELQKNVEMYRITFRDGRTIDCCKDHQWLVWDKYHNRTSKLFEKHLTTKKTEELFKTFQWLRKDSKSKDPNKKLLEYRYAIPKASFIAEDTTKNLPIDPYTLGLLLGDGCMTSKKTQIDLTTKDQEIIDYCLNTYSEACRVSYISYRDLYVIGFREESLIKANLKALGLFGTYSDTKFIPKDYLFSSFSERLELLKGLLDTDGTSCDNTIEYYTVSDQLSQDVQDLVRSLGFNCSHTIKENTFYKDINGIKIICKPCHRIRIYTDFPIFKLKRKLKYIKHIKSLAGQSKYNKTFITNIEKISNSEGYCIEVEHPSHTYITKDYIVTHNTSWGANECAREFLTDAAREYNPGEPSTKAEIIVGAFDAKLSTVPVKALQLALSELPGAQTINGRYYPCPLSKITSGSFMPSKDVEHYYRKKIGGKWLEFGSRSIIKHRTYGDNPFASQGGRYTTKLAEEIGMWDNLLDCHHADENQVIGNSKLGSTLYIGTGGDMKSGTLAAHKMFYDPEGYNCVYMEDRWENRGKIGIFISATETKMDYKNTDGVTDFLLGEKTEIERRAEKKKAKEPGVYEEYIIYNPLVPSEIFLSKTHNVFPIGEIQARLAELETNKIFTDGTYIGTLDIDTLGNLTWKENRDLEPIYDYPVRKKQHGCITIFNPPITDETDQIPYGRYIAGLDPFAQDGAESSVSLGSFFIYDRFTDNIVAEYTGRPDTTNEYHESCRRLLKYYRAKCLYENQIKGFFDYMKFKNETYLLADQPSFLKDIIKDTGVNREKGFHMTKGVKSYGISLINNYLRSSAEDPEKPEKLSVHKVRSIGLLKELMYFNDDGNFDRIVSFMACLFLKQEMIKMELDLDYNTTVLPRQQQNFFNKPLFNKKVFY